MTHPTPQTTHDDSELRRAIGFMRQWLNEDRITDPKKMVTNEELWSWLEPGIAALVTDREREAREDEWRVVNSILNKPGVQVSPRSTAVIIRQEVEDRIAALKEKK